jgi:hypothetical protein
VRHPFDVPQPEREIGLRALERLDLTLLVDAEHQRLVDWIEIEPDDVTQLLHEERIGGEFEGARAMLSAMALFTSPSAERRMICARRTRPWGNAREFANAVNCARSLSLSVSSSFRGRPRGIEAPKKVPSEPRKD